MQVVRDNFGGNKGDNKGKGAILGIKLQRKSDEVGVGAPILFIFNKIKQN